MRIGWWGAWGVAGLLLAGGCFQDSRAVNGGGDTDSESDSEDDGTSGSSGGTAAESSGSSLDGPGSGSDETTEGEFIEPWGERVLSTVLIANDGMTYQSQLDTALQFGMSEFVVSLRWSEVAPDCDTIDPQALTVLELHEEAGSTVVVSLDIFENGDRTFPPELAEVALEDPQVSDCIVATLDRVLDATAANVIAVRIGDETDDYLAGDDQRWENFAVMYQATVDGIHDLRPGMDVSLVLSDLTLLGIEGAGVVAAASDFMYLDVYPLDIELLLAEPDFIGDRLDVVAEVYPELEVHVVTAYPSSPEVGGSPELQAAFVEHTMLAWDHHVDQVRTMSIGLIHDPDPILFGPEITGMFRDYLSSLGLHDQSGVPKPAAISLVTEVERRLAR